MADSRIPETAGTLLAVYPSRFRAGLLVGVGALLVVAALWMAWDMRAADWSGQGPLVFLESIPPVVRSPAMAIAALLIAAGLVLTIPLLLPGPFATLDGQGIVVRSRFVPARFAWADLDGVTVAQGRAFLGLVTARKPDGTIARKWVGIPIGRASNVTLDDLFSVVTRFRPDVVSRS
jgi:hypothetical protein